MLVQPQKNIKHIRSILGLRKLQEKWFRVYLDPAENWVLGFGNSLDLQPLTTLAKQLRLSG